MPQPLDHLVIACLANSPAARPDAVECRRWLSRIADAEWGEEAAIEWRRTHERTAAWQSAPGSGVA
ncbi:MAG: hypothetical protein HOQ09_13405 [Gemmatimonadaceae bacterium]|nr:hypothetical protein [Gemmatimonadaceae bacterium]